MARCPRGGGASGQRGPSPQILSILHGLCADAANVVFIISGRGRDELRQWFSSVARPLSPLFVCCSLEVGAVTSVQQGLMTREHPCSWL